MKDSNFDDLMREAAAIKSAQMSRFRKKFDSWPQFHQAGLYFADKFTHLRDAPLIVKIGAFNEKKDEGTKYFKEGDYQKALLRYEESLCMFRWVSSKHSDWKNKGIEDSDLTIHHEEQSQPVVNSLVTCYLNIALCNLKLDKCHEAMQACDEALALQPVNSKALYRKAMALTQPAGSSLDDYKTAVKLLKQAAKYDPGNEIILGKINEYQEFILVQQAKSKETFHSFFKKSIIQDEPVTLDTQAKLREFERIIEKAEEIAIDFKKHGHNKAAKNLLSKAKQAKKFRSEFERDPFDVDNPSERMLQHAEKYGLDLSDPLIKAELKRLKAGGKSPSPKRPKVKVTKKEDDTPMFSDFSLKLMLSVFLLGTLAISFWYEFSKSLAGFNY
jgi:tetratricopeptide (TPR) repeat protein